MTLVLSVDQRVLSRAVALRFLHSIVDFLEQPLLLLATY
jgi:pyruvate/2-oxoglutarate dehydrogenase complex dihydrolipoamide acyltransferase (E2) component